MPGDATTLHRITPSQREEVFARIATDLAARPDVAFAYVFGSSLSEPAFHDVDVAVWLQESPADPVARLEALARLPVEAFVSNQDATDVARSRQPAPASAETRRADNSVIPPQPPSTSHAPGTRHQARTELSTKHQAPGTH